MKTDRHRLFLSRFVNMYLRSVDRVIGPTEVTQRRCGCQDGCVENVAIVVDDADVAMHRKHTLSRNDTQRLHIHGIVVFQASL